MKIKRLSIKSYKHLEDLNFDFTYPKGHEKAGMPLEKVCFIGQSATGKTNILELFKQNISSLAETEIVNGNGLFGYSGLSFKGRIEYLYRNERLISENRKVIKGDKEFNHSNEGGAVTFLLDEGLKLLYFGSEIISNKAIGIFNQNPLDIIHNSSVKGVPIPDFRNTILEFSQEMDEEVWYSLLSKILDYRKRFTQMASELINKGAIGDLNRLNKKYLEWAQTNENPLIPFADSFNPILNNLNLEVDLISTEYPIPIKSKRNDDVIPISGLSTGTKGLLLSLFPLFQTNTDNAIILIDEPERSLFPDIQINLISYYQQLAPTAQFLVATHSPFIAAAFEPEERFILYFDKNGKVSVRKGESPIGDDPNDMLRNDFKVDYYNVFGKKAYQDYLELKRKMVQEHDLEKKKEILVKLTNLGDKYNFDEKGQ